MYDQRTDNYILLNKSHVIKPPNLLRHLTLRTQGQLGGQLGRQVGGQLGKKAKGKEEMTYVKEQINRS